MNRYEKYKKSYKAYRKKNRKKCLTLTRSWQKENRGHYLNYVSEWMYQRAFGGLREKVLERYEHECFLCGMTDKEHLKKWDRHITLDHIDGNRKNNTMDNLQVLCLSCHGKKDRRRAIKKSGKKLIGAKKIYARDMTYNEYMGWWKKNKYKYGNMPRGEKHWNYKHV